MNVVIIGNGISGITAARHIRKLSNASITVISEEADYFFSRTALMYIYMGHMRLQDTQPYENWFWEKNKISLLKKRVESVDFTTKKIILQDHSNINYDKLIIATGSKSNNYNCKGTELEGVRSLYHLQDLTYIDKISAGLNRAVIVGGGLIGVELAEMFHSRNIPVTFLVRETSFWGKVLPPEEANMIDRHLFEHHIDLKLKPELTEIIGEAGKVVAIKASTDEEISCGFVGITIGVSPNIDFLKFSALKTNKGILVNEFLETNIEDVYAIGDCAELENPDQDRKSIEAIWYTGRMMGEVVAQSICGTKTAYHPGIWFNSAKFFDIEYQVYGKIDPILPEGIETIYWEHKEGKKSIRINFSSVDKAVIGFNLMGIRFRHNICEQWIKERKTIDYVVKHLQEANFDPEFFKRYETEIQKLYLEKFNQ
ncbi:MAG: FAD-dependent oxidoreductase [Saprospiraceae bacterium]|nr:FAD-dependent oxidoreductase [Saprospiraceae bacterium]